MTTDIVQLIKQGRKADIWRHYCGFLDLSLPEFMAIQERLLLEQLQEVGRSELGKKLMNGTTPTTVDEFRNLVPLTEYTDYLPFMEKGQEHTLPRKPYIWAHTSGRSGGYKMVPYSKEVYDKAGERILGAFILAMARHKGDIRLEENDVLLYNAPPAPYSSGVALLSVAQRFPFHLVPSLEETKNLTFHERLEISFQKALVTGIDILGSITSVLVKLGERFAEGASGTKMSRYVLHPKAIYRLGRAYIRSRLAKRSILPKDIWRVKGLVCSGTDTSIYKEKIVEYWGVTPHEMYASTETGLIAALQAWDRTGLYFCPDVVFVEFIPEEEWQRNRQDSSYQPRTVLLDEVQPGQRYEVVITSLHGGPFLRYRMRDLIRFVALQNEELDIHLPSMEFAGRAIDLIDLAGFTGPIDEPLMWRAIHDTGIQYEEWTARKEITPDGAILHVYLEPREAINADEVRQRIHENLKAANPFYADFEDMLGVDPLRLTLLRRGTFAGYFLERQAAGADLAHLKPPHMNPSEKIIADILRISQSLD